MILKFDHVAYACNYESENSSILNFHDYNIIFREVGLKNIKDKMKFLAHKDPYHNIIYLEKDHNIPIEITSYKSIEGNSCGINVIENRIEMGSNNLYKSAKFFSHLGFNIQKEDELHCILTFQTLFQKTSVLLEIKKENEKKIWHLDNEGYCCVAFITDNAEKEKNRFINLGYLCTDIESLVVNGKELEIFFVQGKCGEVVEVFSIKKGRQ